MNSDNKVAEQLASLQQSLSGMMETTNVSSSSSSGGGGGGGGGGGKPKVLVVHLEGLAVEEFFQVMANLGPDLSTADKSTSPVLKPHRLTLQSLAHQVRSSSSSLCHVMFRGPDGVVVWRDVHR